MGHSFKNVILSVFLLSVFGSADKASAGEKRGMDDLAMFAERISSTQDECDKATYSKDFSSWCNFYLSGEQEKSDRAWARVLKSVENSDSIILLQRKAATRLLFADIPKGSPIKKVELLDVFQHWLKVAKQTMGENHRFVGDAYASLANYYEGQKLFRNAAINRIRQFNVYNKALGSKNHNSIKALFFACKALYNARDYKTLEARLKQAIAMSESAKYSVGIRESVKLYITLLKQTNRASEAEALANKYRRAL